MANGKPTKQVTIRQTVLRNTGITIRYKSRWKGLLTGITVHWPAGCNALVEVGAGIEERYIGRIFPVGLTGTEPRIALDDATKTWPLNVWIDHGDQFWIEIYNYDNTNPHTISVILDIETEETNIA